MKYFCANYTKVKFTILSLEVIRIDISIRITMLTINERHRHDSAFDNAVFQSTPVSAISFQFDEKHEFS